MDGTVVIVRSGLIKLEREFVVCAERLRFESFVDACDRVLNVIPIHPRYRRSRRHRDVLRHEAEVIDQDFDLLGSHLPLLLVVLHIIDCSTYTLEVSFTHFRSESGRFELASLYRSLFLESHPRPPLDVLSSL